ncbi:MAG: sterol desaturase family protein [Kiloniellales bacterium]
MRETTQASKRSGWNWQPELPIEVSPLFDWPPRPLAWLKWMAGYWLAIGAVTLEFGLAWAIYLWFLPAWETMQSLHWAWVLQVWLGNLALLSLVAGGLHLWFYGASAQGQALKFDSRPMARNQAPYSFRNQVLDNVFWSLASGVTIWTLFQVLYFWAAANGFAPLIDFADSPLWFLLWFPLIPLWSSFHFYWVHRALHWPPLYRLAHALHHRNVNVGPWTGISMHPIEHLLYFSSVLIHFVVPSHPVHVLFHFYLEGLNPAFSHSGYGGLVLAGKKRMATGDFFHQLHHRYFRCNFGTAEVPLDRLFGSFHDGSAEATRRLRARLKEIHGGAKQPAE